jgi:leucyl/phenylalanyl-tRNA---protein transferase
VDREPTAGRTTRHRLARRRDEAPTPGPVLARAPRPVPPSNWVLPDPHSADEDGVVGVGADLSPATLVDAYRRGIFPWPHPGVPLPWFSPDPRGIIMAGRLHRSRSLRATLRRCGWTTTVDRDFEAVVRACGDERGEIGTWITDQMVRAYLRLHELGWAHSLEVWDGAELVGGVYGVQIGGVFTGESMFHRRTDASKVALVDLDARLLAAGGRVLDVQVTTDHLASLGARDVPREQFLRVLAAARGIDARLAVGEREVARLAATDATAHG